MIKHNLDGSLDLAVVKAVDPDNFRGTIKMIGTGALQECIMNPSPFGGHMPTEGSLIVVYSKQGWYFRHLLTLSDVVPFSEESAEQRLAADIEEPTATIERLEPGESFYGHYSGGRLRFDSEGSAFLSNRTKDLSFKLSAQIKRAELTANDFLFATHGNGIRIWTSGSVPTTFGDTLRIEKNVATVSIPKEITKVDAPVANISYFEIDKVGGMTLSATIGTAKLSLSGADITGANSIGQAKLQGALSSITFSPAGDVDVFGPIGQFSMGATGEISLNNKVSSLTLAPAGIAQLASKADMTLLAGTSLLASATTSITLQANMPLSLFGQPVFTGTPVSIPLIGAVAIWAIPISINGVPVGHIPVIA